MKKSTLIIFLCVTVLTTNSCDWFRARMGMPTSQELTAVKVKNIQDSLLRADYARLLAAEQARLQDSVVQATEKAAELTLRYHVIFGSFLDQTRASHLMQEMTAIGLKPKQFNFRNGFLAVSGASFNNLAEATRSMDRYIMETTLAPYDIWVYDTQLRLHTDY